MKRLDILGVICIIAVLLLVLDIPEFVKDKLPAATSTISQTSTARAVIVSATENVPGDGKTPAKITVKVLSSNTASKNIPLANYCISAKHVEDGIKTDMTCGPSDAEGLTECSYTVATPTISKFKVCHAVQCGSKPAFSNCGDPLDKTVVNFYGKPSKNLSWLKTIKNGSYPSDPNIVVKAYIIDDGNNPIPNFPVEVKVRKISDNDEEIEQVLSCGLTDAKGETLCQFTASSTGSWRFSGTPTFWNNELGSVTLGVESIPNHIVWTVKGSDIFDNLVSTSDVSGIGSLRAIALSEPDVVGSVSQCEHWENLYPRGYDWCFKSEPKQIKDSLGLRQYVIIVEPSLSSCLEVGRNTYNCRHADATLRYVTEIAKKQSNSSGKFVFDGIILDEPAYRSHRPGGDGNSIYLMDHPSRLIHKIFEETQKVHPGFKIILAENSTAFVKEMLKPGSDNVVRKYDLISGYWYYSPNPTYFKSLVPQYAKGSGMWVNATTWNPYAAETIKKYGMNTVFYLFGTGEGLNITFSTLRDQILPALK